MTEKIFQKINSFIVKKACVCVLVFYINREQGHRTTAAQCYFLVCFLITVLLWDTLTVGQPHLWTWQKKQARSGDPNTPYVSTHTAAWHHCTLDHRSTGSQHYGGYTWRSSNQPQVKSVADKNTGRTARRLYEEDEAHISFGVSSDKRPFHQLFTRNV